jgi:hypothetical protein
MLADPGQADRESDDFGEVLPEGVGVAELRDDLIAGSVNGDFEHGDAPPRGGLLEESLHQEVRDPRVAVDHDGEAARPGVGVHPIRAAAGPVKEPEPVVALIGLPGKK